MPGGSAKKGSSAGTKRRLDFEPIGKNKTKDEERGIKKRASSSQQQTLQSSMAKHARSTKSFTSPVSSKRLEKRAIVTPEEATSVKKKKSDSFVPKYIHKNLGYHCAGASKVSPTKLLAFEHIVNSHIIPDDLEQSRAYGPLSGSCFEERVLQAYSLGKLAVQDGYDGETNICTQCANKGHKRMECPTLI